MAPSRLTGLVARALLLGAAVVATGATPGAEARPKSYDVTAKGKFTCTFGGHTYPLADANLVLMDADTNNAWWDEPMGHGTSRADGTWEVTGTGVDWYRRKPDPYVRSTLKWYKHRKTHGTLVVKHGSGGGQPYSQRGWVRTPKLTDREGVVAYSPVDSTGVKCKEYVLVRQAMINYRAKTGRRSRPLTASTGTSAPVDPHAGWARPGEVILGHFSALSHVERLVELAQAN